MPNIQELRNKLVTQRGDALALRFGILTLTYRELHTEIDRAVAGLGALGVGKGSSFAMLCQNRPEVMVAYYAAARLGAIFVPINPSLAPREVAHVVSHSGSVMMFYDDAMSAMAEQAVPAEHRRPLHALYGASPVAGGGPLAVVEPNDDFIIIYTSGSTGTPKAVLFDQEAEIRGNASLIDMWGITETDVTLVALPLGFLYGLSTAAATGLQAGGQVVIHGRFHPGEVLQGLVEHRATIYHGVPTMFTMMLEFAEQNDLSVDLSFMRLLVCAGAPLPAELRTRFQARFNKAIDDYYALTEVRPIFGRMASDPRAVPHGAIGRVAPGAAVRIVDSSGGDVPDGSQGELLVRAPATLKRYFKDEDLTRVAFQDGLFRTGDLGYRDGEGFFHLTGRIKDIIIRGGANIAPAEVEAVIAQHPDVQSAAVVGVPDPRFGEVAFAFVVRRSGTEVSAKELTMFCQRQLAEYKVPAGFQFVPEFALGVTGKVDKNALKAQWARKKS